MELARNAIQNNKVWGIVLASGYAKRLRPINDQSINTFARPKAIVPIGNRVSIDFSIEALKQLGLKKIFVGAGPLSKMIEEQICNPSLYGIDVSLHAEEKILDTAGTVNHLLNTRIKPLPDDAICVLPCDTPHNIDLEPILEQHLENKAALTIAVLPIDWWSKEWDIRSFGTVGIENMPIKQNSNRVESEMDRSEFEDILSTYITSARGKAKRVTAFLEKKERKYAPSNLINIGIYFFSARLLMELAPFITEKGAKFRFSDYGFDVFPVLAKGFENYPPDFFSSGLLRKIEDEVYPFYAYVVPETNSFGKKTYWRDVVDSMALWKINMDVLDGHLYTWLGSSKGLYWKSAIWGWIGNNSTIDDQAKISIPEGHPEIGSIIGNFVHVANRAKIVHSVIGDHTNIEEEATISNSVIFPGTIEKKNLIGKGVKIINSLFLGGKIPIPIVDLHEIRDAIIYQNPSGGLVIEPLSQEKQNP